MPRKLNLKQGREQVKKIMDKYPDKMRDKKVRGMIDNVLWAVGAGAGPKIANSIITQYELNRPANGSHEFFDDDETMGKTIHLDPNFKVPDDEKIYPGDKRHPGKIKR